MIEGNNKSTPWTTVARMSWEYAFKVEKHLSKMRREALQVEETDRPIGKRISKITRLILRSSF